MRSCSQCQATVWEGARRCHACGADLGDDQPSEAIFTALIGRRLGGKFVLRELIGSGASGFVFRADQETLGRTVAVKILRPRLSGDPELVRRFHDEALAASRLNHPNVLSVIDYGQTEDGQLYIVMEYLRGRTLSQIVRNEGPIPIARVVGLMAQVLDALEEAHAAGVVHADLKSDNVVVETLRGGGDLVKVVDFGIARMLDATPRQAGEVTSPPEGERTISGTPEYMAPEVISGNETTPAADQYAAGILLFELLTGATPFAGGGIIDVLARHITEDAPAPATRKKGLVVPRLLEDAMMRALAKDPGARFPGVADLRTALRAAIATARPADVDETRVCLGCGADNPARFKFCPECGERWDEVTMVGLSPISLAPEAELAARVTALRWTPALEPSLFPLPLEGREAELDELMQFLAGGRDASALAVVAPVGTGKSRLINAACNQAAGEGMTVIIAGPDPTGLRGAWYPIRAAVATVLELPPVCDQAALSARLAALDLPARDAPGLTELFGPPGALTGLDAAVRRREATAAAMRTLRSASHAGPAVLVFEDVDRYDALSRDLLRRLVEHPLDGQLRLLITTAAEHAQAWPDGLARLDLAPLGAETVGALAEHVVRGEGGALDLARLPVLTRGEPLHLEHALRWHHEGGELAQLPAGLADLIAARADRVSSSVRVVLQAVAVGGLEVHTSLLAPIVATQQIDAVTLRAALDLLVAHGYLLGDDELLGFSHALVRDVVYDSAPADVRRALHHAYTDVLADRGTQAIVGHHADLAGRHSLAVPLLIEAGDAASYCFDDAGAAAWYGRALAAARRVLASGDEAEPTAAFLSASIKLADSLRVIGDLVPARGIIEEALHLCDGTQKPLEAQLRRSLGYLHLAGDHPQRALEPIREAIGLALGAGRLDLLVSLYADAATACARCGDQVQALRELEEGIDVVTLGEGLRCPGGPADLWRLGLRVAELHHQAGRRRESLLAASHALRHAESQGSSLGRARVNTMLGKLYEVERDHAAANRHRSAAVDEMRRLGDRRATAELLLATATTGQLRVRLDMLAEVRTLSEEIGWSEGLRRGRLGT